MCRAKSDPRGGKICLIHAAASKGTKAYTKAKTKAPDEVIHATLKELSKEGRQLEAPTQEEVTEFLNKETFKVTLDPDLTDIERRKILRNLTKAREEAEMGTTPGAFHAWKNLMHRVVDKMKMLTKPLLAGGTALLLAGCVGGGGVLNPTNEPLSQPTSSSSESSSAAGVAICSTMTEDQVDGLGDAYPAGLVTDQYGEYCKLTINPASKVLEHDPANIDSSVFEYGFTEEEAFAAQDAGVKWIVGTLLDSDILDGAMSDSLSPVEWGITTGGLNSEVWNWDFQTWRNAPALNGFTPPFERDGNPRILSVNLSDIEIIGQYGVDGRKYIVMALKATTTYKATDEQVKAMLTNYGHDISNEVLNDDQDSLLTIEWKEIRVAYDKNIAAGVVSWLWKNDVLVDGIKVDN